MDILLTFIEAIFFIIIYFMIFMDYESGFRKYVYESIILAVAGTLTFFLFIDNGIWATFALILIVCFILSKRYKKNIILTIIEILIACFSIVVAELIATLIILLIYKNDAPYHAYFTALGVAMIIILPSAYIILKERTFNIEKLIERYSSIILCSINGIIFIMFIKILMQNIGMEVKSVLQCGVLILSMLAMNFYYFFKKYKYSKKNKKTEIKESINPLIHELIDEMKAKEHEYKNHMNILYCITQLSADQKLIERARNYMNEATDGGVLSELTHIDNTILKAILLSKINKAEKREIEFTYEIYDHLKEIPLDDSELTVVLTNLLNNAIEAAYESKDKVMELITDYDNGKYIITVSNSTDSLTEEMLPRIQKIGVSTKGNGRGYGIYNMQKIIKKYKGKMNMNFQGDLFNITIEI